MGEDIVQDPREADVGSILGWGFAPYTGGTLSYIDTIGAKAFVARAKELEAAYGDQFTRRAKPSTAASARNSQSRLSSPL